MLRSAYITLFDKISGAHYVSFHLLGKRHFFLVPEEFVKRFPRIANSRKSALYNQLKQLDRDQYVLVERKPGAGFEPVLPATPTYDHGNLRYYRDTVLSSIENEDYHSVQLHYYIDPQTLAISANLEYRALSGEPTMVALTATALTQEQIKSLVGFGKSGFVVATEEVIHHD